MDIDDHDLTVREDLDMSDSRMSDASDEDEEWNQGEREESSTDEEEHDFDITLPASHSYMGEELAALGGRALVGAGWTGRVPVQLHGGVVFPGETVPMQLPDQHDAAALAAVLATDKLFGLLSPSCDSRLLVSGWGTLCEVFEAALGPGSPPVSVSFKARALCRFRMTDWSEPARSRLLYERARACSVLVVPDAAPAHPLRLARPACLDARRRHHPALPERPAVRRLDAAVSPWPPFVFDMLDYSRLRSTITDYFRAIKLEHMLPEEPVQLSFWVASNLPMSLRDRLELFRTDNALMRLHLECQYMSKRSGALCCVRCGRGVARRSHALAMSVSGAHGNYSNPGGVLHGVLTVARAPRTRLAGAPERHYSWFPGYLWTVALCGGCGAHVGWRFTADGPALRPRLFYGLCRDVLAPRAPRARRPHVA